MQHRACQTALLTLSRVGGGSGVRRDPEGAVPCSGVYIPESDEKALTLIHCYAKDHRPDLKQALVGC